MNTLVAGGTGFIGTALVSQLLKDGNEVIILTRDKRRVDSSFKGKVEILEADICNLLSLEKINFSSHNIDIIFHLAASLNYFGDKRRLLKVNVEGTINLLNCAKRNGIKKFIFTSSIEAMGMIGENKIPADETLLCKPVSTYGESKIEAEKQVRKFAEKRDLNVTILRLGNVYGPGSPGFIVPIANAIQGEDNLLIKFLPVYKDRYLHFVYIGDLVDGMVAAAQKSNTDGTFILADEEFVTIGTLFSLIAQELNADIDLQIKKNIKDALYLNLRTKLHRFRKRADLITYFMAGKGKMQHRAYSIGKAKKQLDYAPMVSLKDGIAKTVKWAKREGLIKG